MYKIAIIGKKGSVSGFMALGFSVNEVEDAAEAREALRAAVADGGYAVVFVVEDLAREIDDEIERCKSLFLPAVTVIPGVGGSDGYGMENLKKATERAVGADILLNN